MFYSQFILAKKGPLGTIWIAAHLERKLRKNQVADTDIGVSVDSILFPEAPIALRLSSHLLLGVVRIYSKKVNYLFHDCSEALLKIKQAFRSTAVDLPPEESIAPYHSITLPETFQLDDFELPDSTLNNFIDHHVSTKEAITLQDTLNTAECSTSQFGLDERFGDGDVSQMGFDIDEDLFLDKGLSAQPDVVAQISEQDTHCLDKPSIDLVDMDVDKHDVEDVEGRRGARSGDLSEFISSDGDGHLQQNGDVRREGDPFHRHGCNPQTPDLNELFTAVVQPPLGFSSFTVSSPERIDIDHAPPTPGIIEGTIPANEEAVPDLNPQERVLPSINVEFVKDAIACNPIATSECPTGTKNNDHLHPFTNMTVITQAMHSSTSDLTEPSGLVKKLYDPHNEFGDKYVHNLQHYEKNSQDTDQGLGKGGIVFLEASNLEHHVYAKHLDEASNMVLPHGTGIDSSEQACTTSPVPLSTVFVTETTAASNRSVLNWVPRASTSGANDVSESASSRISSLSFLNSDFNLRPSSMQSKHSDVLSVDETILPANAPIIHIGESGEVCPASPVPLTSVLVKEKVMDMNSDITTFNGEDALFILNEQKHVYEADNHISGAATPKSDSAYFNLQSNEMSVVENRNFSDNAAKVPSQFFQTSNLSCTGILPAKETTMYRNSWPVNEEAANFIPNKETHVHEAVSHHTLGTSVLNPNSDIEPSFQPSHVHEFSDGNRIVVDNTSNTGTSVRHTTVEKNRFTADEAGHFHLDVENRNFEEDSCRISDTLAHNSDFNSRSSLLSNHASVFSTEKRDFLDNALCKGSSPRERNVENDISMFNEGGHVPNAENHAHQSVSCPISGTPVLNSDFNIRLGSQSSKTNAISVGNRSLLDNTLDSGALEGESTVKRDTHMINEGAGCLIPIVESHVHKAAISGMSLPRSDLNLIPNCSQSSHANVLSFGNRGLLDNVHDTATSVRETAVEQSSSVLNEVARFPLNMNNHVHGLPSYACDALVLKSDLNLRPSSSLSNQVTPSSIENVVLPDNMPDTGSIRKPEFNFQPFSSQSCQTSILSAENRESLDNISGTVIKDPSPFFPSSQFSGSDKLAREITVGRSSTSLNKEVEHLIPNAANHTNGAAPHHISSSSTITSEFNITPLSSQSNPTRVLSTQDRVLLDNASTIHVGEHSLHSANSSTVVQGQSFPSAYTMHKDEQSTGVASKMAYFDYQNRSSSEFTGLEKMVFAPVDNINLLNDFSRPTGERGFVESSASVDRINKISGAKRQFMDSTPVLQNRSSSKLPGRQNFSKNNEYVPAADDKLASILVGRTSSFRMEPTPTTQKTTSFKRPRLNSAVGLKKRKVLLDDAMVMHADSIRLQLMNTEDIRRLRRKAPCTRQEIWIIEKCSSEEIFEESVLTDISAELYSLYSRSHIWCATQTSKVKTQYNAEPLKDAAFASNSSSVKKRDGKANVGLLSVLSTESPSVIQESFGAAGPQITNNLFKKVAQRELHCTTPASAIVSAEPQSNKDVFRHDTQGQVAPQADIPQLQGLGGNVVISTESPSIIQVSFGADGARITDNFSKQVAQQELHVLSGNVVCTTPASAIVSAEEQNSRDVFSGNEVCTATPDIAVSAEHDAQVQARPEVGILDLQELSYNDVCTASVSEKYVLPWKDGLSSPNENGVTPAANDTITKDPIHASTSSESCHGKGDDAYRIPQRPAQNMINVSDESIEINAGMLSCCQIVPVEVPPLIQDSVSKEVADDISFPYPTNKTSLRNEESFSYVDPSPMVTKVDQTSAEGVDLDYRTCLNISAFENSMSAPYNVESADKNSQTNLDCKGDDSVVGVAQTARTVRDIATFPSSSTDELNETVSTVSVVITADQQVMEKGELSLENYSAVHHTGDNYHPPVTHEASVNASDPFLVAGPLETEYTADKMPSTDVDMVGQDEVRTHPGDVQNAMTMLHSVATLAPGFNSLNEIVMPIAASISDQEGMKKNNETQLNVSVNDEAAQKLLINVEGPALEMPGGGTKGAASYSTWTATETINIPSTVKENSEVQALNQESGMDVNDVPSNLDATKEANDFCNGIIDNATEFLNVDDEDAENIDGAGKNGVPNPQGAQSHENTGWSSRTRGVAKYLKSLFNDEHGHGRKAVAVDHLLTGKTRKEASRMFFETLVLKTRDYIDVNQEKPFDCIHINPRTKLLKSDF